MVCCDTNFLVDLIRENQNALLKLDQLGDTPLTTTIINVAELHKGAYRRTNYDEEIGNIRSLLNRFEILNLDDSGCNTFGRLSSLLKSNPLGDADLLIASIAISNGHSLLTNDAHFDRISELSTDVW